MAHNGRKPAIDGLPLLPCNRHLGLGMLGTKPPLKLGGGLLNLSIAQLFFVILGVGVNLADLEGGLRIIDVSMPARPHEVGSYDTPGWAYDVAVSLSYAYVADQNHGLRVIDVSEPTNPTEVGFFVTPPQAIGVAVTEGYVYLADYGFGMQIFRECGVFLDSFDSGDTSAWSSTVP